jgi:steroid delta-isomerase-like uncharacterized protein
MSAEENKDLVRRVVDAGNKGDVSTFRGLFADNFVHHDPAIGTLDNFLGFLGSMHAGIPDGYTTIEDMVAEGDEVAKRWTLRGTHSGELFGVPATGKEVSLPGMSIYRISGGKVTDIWWNTDSLGLLQQIGALPRPESAGV